ncbi:MAG: cell division protein FtsZ [Geminicoccaceae bacterium]
MTLNLSIQTTHELKPKITVIGVGGAGGNAVTNMIQAHLEGVEFVVANTDHQALSQMLTDRRIQLGTSITNGLGAGARPEVGRSAAEEALDEILAEVDGSHMVFITAGMGGGTGTGAAPVIARAVRERGILTVGVVTKPFSFEGAHRMRVAEAGLEDLQQYVDTLIVIPNQNLFRIANERTTLAEAFGLADQVLHMGVRGVTDLIVMPGLINLDFADIRTVMAEMGKAMMGTGEAEGDRRAIEAAEAAISNPLLDEVSMKGAGGVLINITGGTDMTLFEVDAAANRIRDEVDEHANIIFGSTYDETMQGRMRVSVVATGIEGSSRARVAPEPAAETLPTNGGGIPNPATALRMAAEAARQQPMHHAAQPQPASDQAAFDPRRPVRRLIDPDVSATEEQDRRWDPRQGYVPPASVDGPIGREATVSPAATLAGAGQPAKSLFRRVAQGLYGRRDDDPDEALRSHSERLNAQAKPERLPAPARVTVTAAEDEVGDIPEFLKREKVDA